MREFLTVLLILAAGGLSYWFSLACLPRLLPRRGQLAIRAGLAFAAIMAGFNFSRPWLFPLAFGLVVGNLLSAEFS